MINALTVFSKDEQRQVSQSIAALEKKTAAEVVCAVSTESGRYDRAESIVGLIVAAVLLALTNIAWVFLTDWSAGPGGWHPPFGLPFMFQLIAVLVGFIGGSIAASYYHPLRRPFVRQKDKLAEAERAASIVFSSQRLHSTRHVGGVLVYVSLFERKVIVLADDGAMKVLEPSMLDAICESAVKNIKDGKRVETFLDAVKALEPPLTESLPIGDNDVNELPDHLVCIHPRP
ncbi:MAG: hypothetical protein HON53_03845 [Planctomycetaceae bacterium]|jgi:putative membrane protein|nr:hypothetical protein [Planctomycetaceae bacterium]MBT6154148.1 hypothetical protein [Planctomycetaceae bacterium]MBT6487855.1 hypothetical protein [Planctomycetaceae bacterium]MBT6495683.1 hypothetical protein [Planctomycetaceae bacterium]